MKTILIADDDANLRMLARLTLNDPEYKIIEAADGREALDLARSLHPDLLVLDWMMPNMNGIEVTHALQGDPHTAHIPIIMLTAKARVEDQQRGRAAGVQSYLVKPFSPLALREQIKRIWNTTAQEPAVGLIEQSRPGDTIFPFPSEPDHAQIMLFAQDLVRVINAERQKATELAAANLSLQAEIEERKRAENTLRHTQAALEHRVAERTAALSLANEQLTQEIAARRQAEEGLHTLSRQVLEAQESERRRLARELHDEIGQALTALKFNLHAAQRQPETLKTRLDDSLSIVDYTLQQVRNLSFDLRPSMLDELGLVAAVNWYMGRQAERGGFTVHVKTDALPADLCPTIATTCFRVVQEAVTNVIRHARATEIWVDLRSTASTISLLLRDNGNGFDVPAALKRATLGASMGLPGMQERVRLVGGEMEITSAPGQGTAIHVELPLMMKGAQ
jgi:signal transduction histidine kinase